MKEKMIDLYSEQFGKFNEQEFYFENCSNVEIIEKLNSKERRKNKCSNFGRLFPTTFQITPIDLQRLQLGRL